MGAILDALKARFGAAIVDAHEKLGDETAVVAPENVVEVLTFLRDDPAMSFDLIVDETAVDYHGREPRFEVVVHLRSHAHRHFVRVKVPVGGEEPSMPTLSGLWKGCNWLEREIWDMYGIRFEGHPDLRRILMYESFEGHPLRKDYPVDRRQPIVPERDPIRNPWPPRETNLKS